MKRRPETTTSERELIAWLAEGGRVLPLNALAGWRKHGLLPPLDSCGTGAGRAYYWRDPLIRRRARAACDRMERTSHVDQTLWGLWLRGFPVPAAKLKRAWQHGTRLRRPWLPVADLADRHDKARCSKETLLTEVTRKLGRTLPTDRRDVAVLLQ